MSRIHEALKRAEQERGNRIEAVSSRDLSASAMSAAQNAFAGAEIRGWETNASDMLMSASALDFDVGHREM